MFSTLAKLLFYVAISCSVFFSTFPHKMSDKERIKDVCQMISKGAYNMSQANDKTPSKQKGIVDHYHQVVWYCDIDIEKTGFSFYSDTRSLFCTSYQHTGNTHDAILNVLPIKYEFR